MNLATIAEGHPGDAVAFVSRGKSTTYGDLARQVAAMRGGLQRAGIAPGDRVAVACANNRDFVVSFLAILGVGAIAVPVNPASPTPELQRELDITGATAVIAGPSGAAAVDGLDRTALAELRHVFGTAELDAMLDGA
ncbi:MAG: long-chain acyl-CoA synthetase, partial [Actinomycetota bacterium]|nr:long-chain acyl-CoA synthetase [Actinomycetota bacterium]